MKSSHINSELLPETQCELCGRHSILISSLLRVCGECIQQHPESVWPFIEMAHAKVRHDFGMMAHAPHTQGGKECPLCIRHCVLGEGEVGFCGLRMVCNGQFVHLAGVPARGILQWHRDSLPTNRVGMENCVGQNKTGYHNLAVFYGSCSLNCLFCQNWHYRDLLPKDSDIVSARQSGKKQLKSLSHCHVMSADELAATANSRTSRVYYFGGDPASQMPHALASATKFAEREVTICWETNGVAHPRLMDKAVSLSLYTKGTVKFDLKAYNTTLHQALTGISNRQILENFCRAAQQFDERSEVPLVIASTLLVPGYVDIEEVQNIARFIARLNPNIPYVLSSFAPNFYFHDLPYTSINHAKEAKAAAYDAGLTNVRIGNRHLLSHSY